MTPYLHREIQAKEELGHTRVSPALAALLSGLFLGLIAGVPLLQHARTADPEGPFRQLARDLSGAAGADGGWAANRALATSLHGFEDRLEEESWILDRLLPPLQPVLVGRLGMANEQVYPGRDGWLFYRPAVDYLTGPGFLTREAQEARRGMGAEWEEPIEPDPLPALLGLHRQLAARGIRLLVVPVPVKASIHPERLSPRPARPPLQNPSFGDFVAQLEAEGIPVLDLGPVLAEAAREGGPQYLETDTHWTPEAMERAAAAVAGRVRPLLPPGPGPAWRLEERSVTGTGDLVRMLKLPEARRQEVRVRQVLAPGGSPWRPDPGADVLLLGDSFTNVFSQPDLGWGSGAGFAEHLSRRLGRPVDRIAVNAGGAHASRQALARQLAAGEDRLAGKRLVIYELAARELAAGDWRRLGAEEEGD
jgi:hypothetical protein